MSVDLRFARDAVSLGLKLFSVQSPRIGGMCLVSYTRLSCLELYSQL